MNVSYEIIIDIDDIDDIDEIYILHISYYIKLIIINIFLKSFYFSANNKISNYQNLAIMLLVFYFLIKIHINKLKLHLKN